MINPWHSALIAITVRKRALDSKVMSLQVSLFSANISLTLVNLTFCAIVAKRCKIGSRLLLIIDRKWHIGFQVTWKSSTSDNLEGHWQSVRSAILATAGLFIIIRHVSSMFCDNCLGGGWAHVVEWRLCCYQLVWFRRLQRPCTTQIAWHWGMHSTGTHRHDGDSTGDLCR